MKTLHLHVHDGVRAATLLFSRFPVLVGRDPRAGCRLEFPAVSRQHARIDLCEGRLTVCDEGSLLGTWVLDKTRRLPPGVPTDLESVGNEISIGDLRLRAELHELVATRDVQTTEMRRGEPNVETSCYADANIDPAALDGDAIEEALVTALKERRRADDAVSDILRQATAIAPAQLARLAQLVVDSDPEWDGHAVVRQFAPCRSSRRPTFRTALR
jgi:hypothetical protein